jgi:nucleoside-specific outer membrane channel protein Tsx
MLHSVKLWSCGLALFGATLANAADWSDVSLGYTTGNKYAEPFGSTSIKKQIYNVKAVSGDKYGQNFFNVDLLQSDSSDFNAQESYAVYRRLFDLEKMTKSKYAFGPVRDMGITLGFDWNSKNDAYASKKRMIVVGPTWMMDIDKGFLDISLLMLSESNAPGSMSRYAYQNHADLSFAWGMSAGLPNLSFEGYADYIGAKGKNEFGGNTAAETHFNGSLMYDISEPVGAGKNTFKLGVGYEYWKNKFGNVYSASSNPGAFAKTPFVKGEYHF